MRKSHILSVRIEHQPDDSPDTSTLGEYTDSPSDWAIVRQEGEYLANLKGDACDRCKGGTATPEDCEEGDICPDCDGKGHLPYDPPSASRREYRFFVPYAGGEQQGTADYQKYGKQDYARMEGLVRGDWSYIGVIAKADIEVNGVRQTIRSGGLWGVESDAGDYLAEVAKEQLGELRDILASLEGFGKVAIDRAFADVETA
jgi:hypothetical protein